MAVSRYEVELTSGGYLYLNAELASTCFPHDAVVATMDAGDLVLWPTSGAFAGGLPLKQRNRAGDRCVLISEIVPADASPGLKEAIWDDQQFRLRVALAATRAVASNAVVQEEQGRWVVYLEVGFWETGSSTPLKVTRSRINDYPTRRDAEVAASWIQRSSDRNVTRPVEGN